MKHFKHTGGRPPLSKARKQEYRITLRLDTEHKLCLQALAVLPDDRARKSSVS